jgi:hypothetical protein
LLTSLTTSPPRLWATKMSGRLGYEVRRWLPAMYKHSLRHFFAVFRDRSTNFQNARICSPESLDSVEHLRVITPCDYPSSFDFIFQEITRPADLALGPCFDLVAPKTMYKYYATRSIFSIELSHRCWLNLLYLCCIAWID